LVSGRQKVEISTGDGTIKGARKNPRVAQYTDTRRKQ